MLNKNTWGVKSAGPIKSNITNRQARPKGLISAEAKKLLYQNICNSLNDTQYFHKYDWLCHLVTFYNSTGTKKGGQVTKPIILVKILCVIQGVTNILIK